MNRPARPLEHMFAAVPRRYDLMNRLLTFRLDERWRRRAARACLEGRPRRVLDLCTGTGDLALRLARDAPEETEILAADFSEPMLAVARKKAGRKPWGTRVTFLAGDAAGLPFPDGHFGAVGIAFAFRNLTYKNPLRDRYLAEMARVTEPGGRLVVIETSQPRSRLLRSGFRFYLRALVAPVGGALSGQRPAYRYLATSARRFYRPEEVRDLLLGAGFVEVHHRPLLGGVAALHVARY